MFSKEKNFYGGHGIVGAQVPLGTGLAFANKYRGNDNVSHRLFRRRRGQPGPGLRELQHGLAVEAAGRLHHREQPLRHGHGGRARLGADRFLQARHLVQHSRASRWTAWTCAPCAAAAKAVEHAREGKGPYILEMQTYRYRGHSMSDPAKYRTRRSVEKMRESATRSSR
jgi:pyruvate dehydrogenase E1 component alpha subunit